MENVRSLSAFRMLLSALGAVALVAGSITALFGVGSIAGAETVSASVDSEMRFFAVWYAGAGWVLLRSVSDPVANSGTIRLAALLFFASGCARVLSWVTIGQPHAVAIVLMVIELALPLIILPWLASVTKADPAAS